MTRAIEQDDATPVAVICLAGAGAAGLTSPCFWPEDGYHLVLMLGNGLEGDVRFTGNNAHAVELARGLIIGTGSCSSIEPPSDSDLYQPGDECYRQPGTARAFLDPNPTGVAYRRMEARISADEFAFHSTMGTFQMTTVVERNQSWSVESFEIPMMSKAPPVLDRSPCYRRGCLTYALEESARFALLPFTRPGGEAAVGIAFRQRWKDWPVCWAPVAATLDVERLVSTLNGEINEAWTRWRASPRFK